VNILVAGASGFIGRHLTSALRAQGHRIVEVSRGGYPDQGHVRADFSVDIHVADWLSRVRDMDIVVNAVGIIRESGTQSFERLHTQAPQALFQACAQTGVRRVIQISALGADSGSTAYFRSKAAADNFLASLALEWIIVRPSLVYGPGGASAQLFNGLASLPVVAVPGDGQQQVQPLHIDDLVSAVVALVAATHMSKVIVPLVGPRPIALQTFLTDLRQALGLRAAPVLHIPMWMIRLAARIAELSPRALLDRNTLTMLEAGNTADPAPTARVLQRSARPVSQFIDADLRATSRHLATLQWVLPLLRVSIAIVWIWTGIVSLGLYPVADSYALLARTGLTGVFATVALYGAAMLDLALGIGTLMLPRRRWLWTVQIILILSYSAIITLRLPQFWLHPYGPLVKNLPMLAGIYLLLVLEE
jgi:nucleoside-diphosphate-sugar epimerase